jgi:endonuclease/exonuclease/phosphatase family metal-dependent hydrolase
MNRLTGLLSPWNHAIHACSIAILVVAALACPGQAAADGASGATVTIATFNIQVFGKSKRSKPEVMEVLADIADEFDILAVQEIRDISGETPGVYLDAMNAQGDEAHEMVVSPRLGRSSSKEEYAFYYDTDVVEIVGEPATYPDPGDVFEREPFLARFRVGGLDFVLANIHIKPDDAVAEIDALDDVHAWGTSRFGDLDIIIAGDLNADCTYFNEDTQRGVLDMNWITPKGFDTTVRDTDCTYDHFVITDSLLDAYTGSIGVFRFDTAYGLTQEAAVAVSDHYPVFAVFSAAVTPWVTAPLQAPAGVGVVISADLVFTGAGVDRATLFYGEGGSAPSVPVALAPDTGDVWVATIPDSAVTMAGLLWYVEVVDTLGQEVREHTAAAPGFISVHGDVELPLTTMASPPNVWNAIAPPISPDNTSMSATFDTEDGGFLSEWFAWRWSADLQQWEAAQTLADSTPVTDDEFELGKGWFVAALGDGGIEPRMIPGQSVDPRTPFAMPIRPGWNLLANPYGFPVEWRDGVVQASIDNVVDGVSAQSPLVDNRLIQLDVSTQSYVTHFANASAPYAIPPGQAWWFLSNATGELIIDPLAGWEGQPAAAPTPVPVGDWRITISAESAFGRDGVEVAASSSLEISRTDSLRYVKAPYPPGSRTPRMSIVNLNADGPLSLLSRSVLPSRGDLSWVIRLSNGDNAVLDWQATGASADYDLILSDLASERQIDLNRDGSLRVEHSGQSSRRFIVRATKRTVPAATALLANFPNPFNPETWIPFELHEAANVVLHIYDQHGRRVRTLAVGSRPEGEYVDVGRAVHWDGRNELGEHVAGGVYVVELRAGTHREMRRIVMAK